MLHPDLLGNAWQNTDEVANNGIDDDNNGYVIAINTTDTTTVIFRTTDGWKSIDIEALRADKAALIESLNPTYLEVWDEILLENGKSIILESIRAESAEDQIVYNLELDWDGVYFADGFMTHHKY